MNSPKPYQKGITFFLLLLYLLISTPVNLWHSHESPIWVEKITTTSIADTEVISADITFDELCSICGHHFATYATVTFPQFKFDNPQLIVRHHIHYSDHEQVAEKLTCTNRGPPVLIINA